MLEVLQDQDERHLDGTDDAPDEIDHVLLVLGAIDPEPGDLG